ncbi:hypothetical protein [Brucella pseudintermedia]|uniref:hypothetical protein n=1 Tax=Brucella pseudintermedia TaxID=370111 RepID=UPI00124C0793|nr:hypothetical protein [Brucella pseudintermedia]KAB2682965.1 hypothetical protein F9K78_08470 [Brucella pseudintermedia]
MIDNPERKPMPLDSLQEVASALNSHAVCLGEYIRDHPDCPFSDMGVKASATVGSVGRELLGLGLCVNEGVRSLSQEQLSSKSGDGAA